MTIIQSEYTFDDLLATSGDKLFELIHGQLVEKQLGFLAIWVATRIAFLIESHVSTPRRGYGCTELPINCFPWIPNHGRRPDVAYYHRERLPAGQPTEDPLTVAPNLVVEVLSKNDEAIDVDVKVEEYLRAGVEIVWIVNPQTRTVRIHRLDGSAALLHERDTITGDTVLPEFKSVVADFFPPPATSESARS